MPAAVPQPQVQVEEPGGELYRVRQWRHKEALEAGFTIAQAHLYADSDADCGHLRELARRGCPPELIFKLLVL